MGNYEVDSAGAAQEPWSPKYIACTAGGTTYLTAQDTCVIPTAPASGTHTIYLPTPGSARDVTFTIRPVNGSGTVTVNYEGSTIVLTAGYPTDYAVLRSDGVGYRVVASNAT